MARAHLTDLAIRKLPLATSGQIKLWDTTTAGFGIIIGKRTKTFVVMFGKDRQIRTLGQFGQISLADARKEAIRLQLRSPHKNAATRLPGLVEAYLADCRDRLRESSVERYEDVLKHAPDIKLEDVKRSIATTPHQVKAYKAMFNFAQREEIYDRNPFQHVRTSYGQRSRILSDDELKIIWHYESPPFSDIVKLLILSGQRKGQIWKLQPNWIGEDTITFPATAMKQGKEHTIPFGDFTAPYLAKAPFSFNGWSKSKARMDKETGVKDWTIHDLRRTFATTHARLKTPIHIVEALLAHTSGQISGVTAIYIRHTWMSEMRDATLAYENHLKSLLLDGRQPEGRHDDLS